MEFKFTDQGFNQHNLERMPVHINMATWQTSEVVGRAPKNFNSYLDAILNNIIKTRHGFKTAQKLKKILIKTKFMKFLSSFNSLVHEEIPGPL